MQLSSYVHKLVASIMQRGILNVLEGVAHCIQPWVQSVHCQKQLPSFFFFASVVQHESLQHQVAWSLSMKIHDEEVDGECRVQVQAFTLYSRCCIDIEIKSCLLDGVQSIAFRADLLLSSNTKAF